MSAAAEAPGATPAAELVSFVPRVTLEWLRDEPDRLWREVEGTLAFVDISGFTAMSERLSGLGKAGAEEVTDVMNSTFAALLEIAYAHGGGLLKFGGDALLLLYTGEQHTGRAARAAFGMRRRLRAIGRPRTSAGAVTLRMHVGIHSGVFNFFLVGDSHRELLVTGPAASETVAMEATSEAGEILLSPGAAAELDPADLGDEKGEGVLLAREPAAPLGLEPLPDVTGIPLEAAVPAPLRAQLLEVGPLEGEHRNAAIGFLRFSGVDEVIESEGPEAAADALEALVRAVQAAADEHRVTFLESDVDRDGGRIVLVAGAPQTFGDEEERLLRTLRAAVDAGLPLPVHVGASRGRVFAGQVGASFRRTYTVLGDTAALAARLMASAGEDEVYVAAEAFERTNGRFAGTELEPLRLKGKSEPARAFLLGELVDATPEPPAEDGKLPFVDRERERAVLAASVAPVRMGFGTMVELIGEPGIGKSRLAEELREQCTDMATIAARCEQYEASTAYHPFRPLLRSLLRVELNGGGAHNRAVLTARLRDLDGELAPWAPLLAALLDVEVESTPEVDELDPSFRRARLHGVVGSLLGRLLSDPTLLLFEDVHWMDEPSSELLRHLGTQLSTRPWLTCTTRRPGDGGFAAAAGTPPLPALTLRLEPLPDADARALIEAAAGRPRSDEEVRAIAERGSGNPLFIQELASVDEAAELTDELPETVQELVATRIDRLAPGDRALLRWASVLGPSFAGAVIADVLQDDPSAASDSEAWDRLVEFVERDPDVPGAFRFRHALIRDAAYEGLSFRRRRELHGRVADVLERRHGAEAEDEAAELLSLHFSRAGRASEAWRYSIVAGRRAQAKWANVEAAEFYRRALDAAKDVPDLEPAEIAAAWEALADCLQLAGELDDAAYALAAARRLTLGDDAKQVVLMRKEGAVRELMGKYSDAIRWYGRAAKAAELLPDEESRTRWRIGLNLAYAQVRFRQGQFRECTRRCHEVVGEALPLDDYANLAPAYLLLHLVHSFTGSPERAAFRGLALPLYEELGDLSGQASAVNNLGIDAYYEGDWHKAIDLYERGRQFRERMGDVTNAAMATNNIGEIRSDQGRLDEAESLFREVVETCDTTGHRALATVARANLGRVAARAGRLDEAQELLEEALAVLREINASSFALEAESRLAEVAALRGEHGREVIERAESVLERADDSAEAAPLRAAALRTRAAGLLQVGDAAAGRDSLAESISVARAADAVYELALSLGLLAAVAWLADSTPRVVRGDPHDELEVAHAGPALLDHARKRRRLRARRRYRLEEHAVLAQAEGVVARAGLARDGLRVRERDVDRVAVADGIHDRERPGRADRRAAARRLRRREAEIHRPAFRRSGRADARSPAVARPALLVGRQAEVGDHVEEVARPRRRSVARGQPRPGLQGHRRDARARRSARPRAERPVRRARRRQRRRVDDIPEVAAQHGAAGVVGLHVGVRVVGGGRHGERAPLDRIPRCRKRWRHVRPDGREPEGGDGARQHGERVRRRARGADVHRDGRPRRRRGRRGGGLLRLVRHDLRGCDARREGDGRASGLAGVRRLGAVGSDSEVARQRRRAAVGRRVAAGVLRRDPERQRRARRLGPDRRREPRTGRLLDHERSRRPAGARQLGLDDAVEQAAVAPGREEVVAGAAEVVRLLRARGPVMRSDGARAHGDACLDVLALRERVTGRGRAELDDPVDVLRSPALRTARTVGPVDVDGLPRRATRRRGRASGKHQRRERHVRRAEPLRALQAPALGAVAVRQPGDVRARACDRRARGRYVDQVVLGLGRGVRRTDEEHERRHASDQHAPTQGRASGRPRLPKRVPHGAPLPRCLGPRVRFRRTA
ncbi:MAG: tetratricopeptide repeat protein [Thermoleophilia bacterium]|nr:tetratricopeptide repeat protein [Thermoleophilia bacterium]